MTKRNFQAKEYAAEQREKTSWPNPSQKNLFEDTTISANYLEQIALAMSSQNIRGASYVEEIASQLRDLGNDYDRVLKERDEAVNQVNSLLESILWLGSEPLVKARGGIN